MKSKALTLLALVFVMAFSARQVIGADLTITNDFQRNVRAREDATQSSLSVDQFQPFTDIDASLTGVISGNAAWGDFDNDGYQDVVLTGALTTNNGWPVTKLFRNNQDGTFTEVDVNLTNLKYGKVAWGDFNNNGYLDLIVTGVDQSGIPQTKIYLNRKNGEFVDTNAALIGVSRGDIALGDYNNNGYLDILLCGWSKPFNAPVTKLYRNNGDGTFTDVAVDLPNVVFGTVAWGDYDNDGSLDILLTGWDADSASVIARVYRNQGNGSFEDVNAGLEGVYYSSAAWGDYNSNGLLDIALIGVSTNGQHLAKIYRNDKGLFVDIGAPLTGARYGDIAWGDYNSDGFLDLALCGLLPSGMPVTQIFQNTGDDAFEKINADIVNVFHSSLAWGDYNNDGAPDLLLTGQQVSTAMATTKIYKNNFIRDTAK